MGGVEDVLTHLDQQWLQAVECEHGAQQPDQLNGDDLPVQVEVGASQHVRLHRALRHVVESRIGADGDRGRQPLLVRRARSQTGQSNGSGRAHEPTGVDAVGRDHACAGRIEVGRGEAEFAAAPLSVDDGAAQTVGAAEDLGRPAHVPGLEELAHPGG